MVDKNHCCPYCGSDNVMICASPIVHVELDDEGHCTNILDDDQEISRQVDELGPEDFACACKDCGKDFNIVFEEADKQEYRFVKCREDRGNDFNRKYKLFYYEQKKDWEETHNNKRAS